MAWRDKLKTKASFRGAEFYVQADDVSGGRRKIRHEFPGRDTPTHEDLGRKVRAISIEGYVLGDNFLVYRDRLVSALESPFLGVLVHPFFGRVTVAVLDYTISENNREGGMAIFLMSFEQSQQGRFPSALSSKELEDGADKAINTVREDFVSKFSTEDKQQFIADDASTLVLDLARDMTAAKQVIKDTSAAVVQPRAEYDRALSDLASRSAALVRSSADLADQIAGLFSSVQDITGDAEQVFAFQQAFFGFGRDYSAIDETTRSRQQQAFNRTKIFELVRNSAVAEASRATIGIDFASDEDARATRDKVLEQIDTILFEAVPDEVFQDLLALKGELVKYLGDAEKDAANIIGITLDEITPALVLSYELYSDAEQDERITDRNNIDHPGFLPAGDLLRVLNSAI